MKIVVRVGDGGDTGRRTSPTHDEIAQLAFSLGEAHGRQEGRTVEPCHIMTCCLVLASTSAPLASYCHERLGGLDDHRDHQIDHH